MTIAIVFQILLLTESLVFKNGHRRGHPVICALSPCRLSTDTFLGQKCIGGRPAATHFSIGNVSVGALEWYISGLEMYRQTPCTALKGPTERGMVGLWPPPNHRLHMILKARGYQMTGLGGPQSSEFQGALANAWTIALNFRFSAVFRVFGLLTCVQAFSNVSSFQGLASDLLQHPQALSDLFRHFKHFQTFSNFLQTCSDLFKNV